MVESNVPQEKYVSFNGDIEFYIGDKVRIQYPEWRGGVVGKILDIFADSLTVDIGVFGSRNVPFSKIWKMRRAEYNEDFNTVPYYDAEEKEFWRTHWITKDGIKEKTAEDIKMLEDFHKKYE